jgi:hypothetical protein
MTPLILKRASASQSSGQWRDDDYDVLEDGVVVGRIFKVAPPDRPWMWASGHSAGTVARAAYGYELTREAAMAALAAGVTLCPFRFGCADREINARTPYPMTKPTANPIRAIAANCQSSVMVRQRGSMAFGCCQV